MIGPLLLILAAVAPGEANGPPVRLAPILCPTLSDADVRAALGVEIRARLLGVGVAPATDFLLVSVSCTAEKVDLLAVRQGAGSPVRREVPVAGLAADARPRAIAVAIAELLRVDLARNSAPPPAVPEPPPAPTRATALAVSATPFIAGGYFSGPGKRWVFGSQLRVALEGRPQQLLERRWEWGLAYELDLGGQSRLDLMNGLSALARWQGGQVVPEIGLGAHVGLSSNYSLASMPGTEVIGGPFATFAIEIEDRRPCFGRMAAEGGFDFGGPGGGWALWLIGGGCRF
ncbi:MAG TPA: hypothetical protein VIK30_13990 [Polyangia bacterium]